MPLPHPPPSALLAWLKRRSLSRLCREADFHSSAILEIGSKRSPHEPTGRANARPMISSAICGVDFDQAGTRSGTTIPHVAALMRATPLTPEEMTKSVTFAELRTMIEIIGRLTANLQHLCQTQTAFRSDILDDYGNSPARRWRGHDHNGYHR